MRLLILGGTIFVGRHCAAEALSRGHQVTLFHRGRHGTDLFPSAERILGDRDGGLEALGHGTWDAVLDPSGYVPRVVDASARYLRDRCNLYVYISSISAYADLSRPGTAEDAALASLPDPTIEEVTDETYGGLKAACDEVVQERLGDRGLVIRPGLIVGPWDPTDRFTYWPVRFARGGEVLVPGDPERPVQFVDVRDLAAWIVSMWEQGRGGVYNAVGPSDRTTFRELIEACREAGAKDCSEVWVSDEFLLEQGVEAWSDLPLWLPDYSEYRGLDNVDGSRAWSAGLMTRPISASVKDALDWFAAHRGGEPLRVGISMEREQELLALWRAGNRGDRL